MSEVDATPAPTGVGTTFPAALDEGSLYKNETEDAFADDEARQHEDQQQQSADDGENGSGNDDDVIPTAIVIKNIPFAIKKEQLLDVIAKMSLPLPYAFNYHFDNGVFRGLAFANFTNTNETTQVLNSLNGKEIGGRRLRVEYKKMLPQAERERIEREKREKRGQLEEQHKSLSNLSLHSLNKSSTNANPSNTQLFSTFFGDAAGSSNQTNNKNTGGLLSAQNTASSFFQTQLSQSHQQLQLSSQQIQPSNSQQSQQIQQQQSAMPAGVLSNERYYAPLPSSSTLPLPPQQLDFNDPDTLEIYSQLLLFKDRERFYYELAYPLGLSAGHKRIINVLCSFLGLVEVYDPTFIVIRRKLLDHATLQSHLQQQDQNSMMNPLQPSSTGGSMNRSHSYTSLLQAHAAASVAAASGNPVNNAISHPNLGASGSASTTPKLSSQAKMVPQTSSQNGATPLVQSSSNSPSQLMQPIALHNTEIQSNQQQQQSFLRQQAALTPSSRIPSGYTTNHSQINTVNPLLRNNGISPPTTNVQPNTPQHRVPTSFFASSSTNLQMTEVQQQQQQQQQQQPKGQLLPQHTNGSMHSNFSIQSIHDDSLSGVNNNDMMYTSLGHTGFGNGLEEGLSRSLSGLDLQGNAAGSNTLSNGNANARKTLW
ncbi:hypothetical protein HG535_0B04510 [Zygotorulaspora mrakii]|uniref:RRM domain-containing protein n=1 Tax=Zygotorulaspora mrakii TaxID=42260 RepID=A0A7H9B0A5_ZYGMR|nr:uncharacterized protein HG535_0B04510 [Zygotorulaspora mrakii]QLG71409.1 hypothetical protein HG535_0B04510 [Zygotorulaspora mrakii]